MVEKQKLRELTKDVVLGARALYLASGANPLKHWTQIQDRMRSAARTTTSAEEWITALLRGLCISETSRGVSASSVALADAVSKFGASNWLDLVERECAYIVALAQLDNQQKKDEK